MTMSRKTSNKPTAQPNRPLVRRRPFSLGLAGLTVLACLALLAQPAQAYIGPGAGIAVLGSFFVMFWAIVAGLFALFTWPLRWLVRSLKHRRALAQSRIKRAVIVGLDGMDPAVTQGLLDRGKLPNLARLAAQGCFKPLQTTTPAISPVAWSSFQTGVNPGKHNIYDFLSRNKHTYEPELSSVRIRPPRCSLKLGKFHLPVGPPDIRLLRKAKPFWNYLGQHGIFSNILRVPITFPPEKFHGVLLSGMCVPDLRGSQGTFTFFSTRPQATDDYIGGDYQHFERNGSAFRAQLTGPGHPFRLDRGPLTCPFQLTLQPGSNRPKKNAPAATLKINGAAYPLHLGRYTPWMDVTFKAGFGLRLRGICQALLLRADDEVELYISPIHIAPDKPVMPIAHPRVYSIYLAKRLGPYATLGLAEDTWALNHHILSDDTFLHQITQGDAEREKMLFDALDKVKRGLVVCVFDGTDRVQHTFWREIDKDHPAGSSGANTNQTPAIETVYRRMDQMIGRVMARCPDSNNLLMVISDHGFNSFRYGVDLNCWLEKNGYLTRRPEGRDEKYLAGIDWSQTRAYAVGLAGLYLNLQGREAQGIVPTGPAADQLRDEIAGKLQQLNDPRHDHQSVVKKVYQARHVFTGPYAADAPDLIVGYQPGYRVDWQTAIGQVSDAVIHDNTKPWSGDHCIDPSCVPGVLFCSQPVADTKPRLMDIGPTVLAQFGLTVPPHMDGRPLNLKQPQTTQPATASSSPECQKEPSHAQDQT